MHISRTPRSQTNTAIRHGLFSSRRDIPSDSKLGFLALGNIRETVPVDEMKRHQIDDSMRAPKVHLHSQETRE
jgi:hypothetical protein